MSEHSQLTAPHRHTTRVAHARHLVDHTGPMPKVPKPNRHYVTSETPQHYTVRSIVAKHAGGTS